MKKPKLHKQEKSYSCMVACLRMVLEFYGINEPEKTLRIKSRTKFYGTHPIHIVECATSYGFVAYAGSFSLNRLQELVAQNVPVITNIMKYDGDEFYIHLVVVFQVEQNKVFILDPEDGEKNLEKNLFKKLWHGNDYNGIIIKEVL